MLALIVWLYVWGVIFTFYEFRDTGESWFTIVTTSFFWPVIVPIAFLLDFLP